MKFNKGLTVLLSLSLLPLASCSGIAIKKVELTGDYVTKEFNNLEASKLSIYDIQIKKAKTTMQINVNIHAGESKKVEVTAQESLFEKLSVNTKNNELTINAKSVEYYVTDRVDIDIYGYVFGSISLGCCKGTIDNNCFASSVSLDLYGFTNLEADIIKTENFNADVSGASSFSAGQIEADMVEADISGASSFDSKIKATSVKVNVSGASSFDSSEITAVTFAADDSGACNMNVKGTAETIDLDVSGASSFDGRDFVGKTVSAKVTGASTAYINAATTLDLKASGASTITVYGEGTGNTDIGGGSTIKKGK